LPIYQYKCIKCNKTKEILTLKINKKYENPVCDCGTVMVKVPVSANFDLKGSGWTKKGLQ